MAWSQNDPSLIANIGAAYYEELSQLNSDDSLNMLNKNRETENLRTWLTGDNEGATPEDLYYVTSVNKLFVYGKRCITVIDVTGNNDMVRIPISNISQFYPQIENTEYLSDNHFAYNPNSEFLYCVREDASIIAINVNDNQVINVLSIPNNCANFHYNNFFLEYNSLSNRIFYAVSSEAENKLFVLDGTTFNNKGVLSFNNIKIRGLKVSETRNEFYLSIDNVFYGYTFDPVGIVDDSTPKYVIGNYASDVLIAGNIVIVNDAANTLDKVFCFPTKNVGTGNRDYFIVSWDSNNNRTITIKQCDKQITSAIYDNDGQVLIAFNAEIGQNDFAVIDADDYSIVKTIDTRNSNIDTDDATLDMVLFNNKILLAKESEITSVDPASNYAVNQVFQGGNNYFSRIAASETNAYVNGVWSTEVIGISTTGNTTQVEVGGMVFYACHNPVMNKIYFYNTHRQERAKVYVYNTTDQNVSIVELDHGVNDIEIHPTTNNALVSTHDASSKIKVIDGSTDQLLNENQWININHGYIGEMFISPVKKKLYCIIGQHTTDGPGIEVCELNGSDYVSKDFIDFSLPTSAEIAGCLTSNYGKTGGEGNSVFSAIRILSNFPNQGWLAEIDDDETSYLSDDYFDTYQIDEDAFDIEYSSMYIYIAHEGSSTITKYLIDGANPNTVDLPGNSFDLETNYDKNIVYALHSSDTDRSNSISIFDQVGTLSTNIFIDLPKFSSSLVYNDMLKMIYLHIPYTDENCTNGSSGIWEILDDETNTKRITVFSFDDVNRPRYSFQNIIPLGHSIVLDKEEGYLYYGGGGHNFVRRIEMQTYERLPLRENITWLSVPRHERPFIPTQTMTEEVFADENISGSSIDELILTHNYIYPSPPHLEQLKYAIYSNTLWVKDDQMHQILSVRGYKITTDPNESRYLYMFGEQEDPLSTIDLYQDKSNWIGYFIEEEQDIFEAIGTTMDDLYEIKHQDWTCIYTEVPWYGPIEEGQEPGPKWYCDQQETHIKYGEMVVVKPFSNITGFQWHDPDGGNIEGALALPEYYTYEEEADYQTYIIELDSTENPQELGAFVGDTSIGACVVTPEDTIAMIKSYNTSSPGDSVVFEEYFTVKKTPGNRIKEYYVYNEKRLVNEKRAIKSDEQKDVYYISFKQKSNEVNSIDNCFGLQLYPNPASDIINIKYTLDIDSDIDISLYDLTGRKLLILYEGGSVSGTHSVNVNLNSADAKNIKKGLYLVKIKSGINTQSQKIVIN